MLDIRKGSIMTVPHPSPKCRLSVRSGSLSKISVCPTRVDSGCLVISYLESVPRSHYGDKAVVSGYNTVSQASVEFLLGDYRPRLCEN